MRVILHTGKGGVGKTTVSAATALRLAESGHRVLVMSTDPAHSLGDSLQCRLGNEPVEVAPNLHALEIDGMAENDAAWGNLSEYFGRLLQRDGAPTIATEEMLSFPGLTELFSLLRILDYAGSDEYDVILVDCAPTGETLSLLQYPERLGHLFEIALPTKRAAAKVLGKPIEKLTSVPMPEDRLFDDVLRLTRRLTQLGELMHDDGVLTLRLVTTPEKIAVAETRRNYTWLAMYGFTVDAVVLNRVFPEAALEGYFHPWAEQQAEGVRAIEESFAHVPVFRLELQETEVVGAGALREVSRGLYGDADPAEVFYRGEFQRVVRSGDGAELRIDLPFAEKADLDLRQDGADILLAYRNEQRRVALPDALSGKRVSRARFQDDRLVLTLE